MSTSNYTSNVARVEICVAVSESADNYTTAQREKKTWSQLKAVVMSPVKEIYSKRRNNKCSDMLQQLLVSEQTDRQTAVILAKFVLIVVKRQR